MRAALAVRRSRAAAMALFAALWLASRVPQRWRRAMQSPKREYRAELAARNILGNKAKLL